MKVAIKAAAMMIGLLMMIGLIIPPTVEAEVMTIEADGMYTMIGDDENPAEAADRARDDAKRAAIEQVSIYVESLSEVRDGKLTEDVIRTVAANVMQIQSSDINLEIVDEYTSIFHCHIVALIDGDAALEKLRQNE